MLTRFKIGDKVTCIDNYEGFNDPSVDMDSEYEILDIRNSFVLGSLSLQEIRIKDEKGTLRWMLSGRFK